MAQEYSHTEIKIGSERSFGLVFAAVFAIIGMWPALGEGSVRPWALAVAAMFVALAYLAPQILRPANVLWARFGILLGKVVAPVVMALVFFIAVTPTALIMRVLGKDPLRLRFDREAKSYWIVRDPAAPQTSMRKQF